MENDEKLDRVENALCSIKEAMDELEYVKDLRDYYMELDVMRCDLNDVKEKLEELVYKEQSEAMEEQNIQYMRSVL